MADFKERSVDLPPYALHEHRGGEGTPLVLVHGLSASSRWWKKNVDALAKRHLVAAIDLVGFGQGRRVFSRPLPLTFDEIASLIVRYLESEFESPVHLVGHSMGGQIAIHVAARRPELVRSLTLVGASGIPFEVDPVSHMRSLQLPPGTWRRFLTILLGDFLRAGPTSVAIATARLLRDDVRTLLARLTMPVLLVWGKSDPLVPLRYGEQMANAIEGSRLVVLPAAGHVAMYDEPEAFNRTLLSFVEEVEHADASTVEHERLWPGWTVRGVAADLAYRQAGPRPHVVLIHGIGIGTHYLGRIAREFFKAGIDVIAPDLPASGFSAKIASRKQSDVDAIAAWASSVGITHAIWIGHSNGCQYVAELSERYPDLVAAAGYLAPIWTSSRHPFVRLSTRLFFVDTFREPAKLIGEAIRSYFTLRWRSAPRMVLDAIRGSKEVPARAPREIAVVGRRDPLADLPALQKRFGDRLVVIDGAHGMLFSNPEKVASVLAPWIDGRP